MNQNPIVKLAEAIQNKQPAALATVIEVKGASPAKVGAQIILLAEGANPEAAPTRRIDCELTTAE